MSLINCNECGKEISDKAKVCVNCGCPIEKIKIEEKIKNKKSFEELSKEEKQYVYTKYRNKTDGKKLGLVIGLIAFIILLTFIMPLWLCFISILGLIVLVLNLDKKEVQKFYEENNFDNITIKPSKEKSKTKNKLIWKIILGISIFMSAFTTLGIIFTGFYMSALICDIISITMLVISISQLKKQ